MIIQKAQNKFSMRALSRRSDFENYRDEVDILTVESKKKSPYITGFAVSRRSIEAALRLRFEIFNIELEEGLSASHATGLDEDPFDSQMTQLILAEESTEKVIGTYRMQTMRQALNSTHGSYSGQEYNLEPLSSHFEITTECGRACLAREHRNMKALIQLWHGIGAFMNFYQQKYLFGCCSLTSTDPGIGWRAYHYLKKNDHLHPDLRLQTTPEYRCTGSESIPMDKEVISFQLPKLFKIYLRMGARVISEPALDLNFKTIDFLVLLNAPRVNLSSLSVVR